MKKLVLFLLVINSLGAVAGTYNEMGRAHGQIFKEFNNMWLDKPIHVYKDQAGNTELKIGNLIINNRGSHYQARCKLTAQQVSSLVEQLNQGLSMAKSYKKHRQDKTTLLGEYTDKLDNSMYGMKVYFFCRKKIMNPTGVILYIKDYEDDYAMKLYLYPANIRRLITLLAMN